MDYQRIMSWSVCSALLAAAPVSVVLAEGESEIREGSSAVRALFSTGLDALKTLHKGTVQTDFAPIQYRLSTKRLKTNFQYDIYETKMQLGYDGKLNLETNWPSFSGSMSFNVTAEPDNDSVYLIRYQRQF